MFLCFFNDTATTEIYTLSLHDALPIYNALTLGDFAGMIRVCFAQTPGEGICETSRVCRLSTSSSGALAGIDRKSTRLNSSHANISYAVFCLKKKKNYHR